MLFPNPSTTGVYVSITDGLLLQLKLYSLQGQLIRQQNAPQLSLTDLPAGMYLIEIQILNGQIIRKRLVKQ
ncbi:MAG: T9SS type A sorting domain-containing protein [Cytophagaceae bacterium]|nr:T9SS type A sorting domain-containing protein [Cytophagaceae bacterium]